MQTKLMQAKKRTGQIFFGQTFDLENDYNGSVCFPHVMPTLKIVDRLTPGLFITTSVFYEIQDSIKTD